MARKVRVLVNVNGKARWYDIPWGRYYLNKAKELGQILYSEVFFD